MFRDTELAFAIGVLHGNDQEITVGPSVEPPEVEPLMVRVEMPGKVVLEEPVVNMPKMVSISWHTKTALLPMTSALAPQREPVPPKPRPA